MPNIPAYQYQVPLRDAPDVEQNLKTDTSMFGGNQANALKAWGGAFDKMSDAAGSYAAAEKEKSAAEVLYGDSEKTQGRESKAEDSYVSDYDRNHLGSANDLYQKALHTNDPELFRRSMTEYGSILQSYPSYEPHLAPGAAQALRDFRKGIEDDERQNYTARGATSTPDDRDCIAHAQSARVLGLTRDATTQVTAPQSPAGAKGVLASRGRLAPSGTRPGAIYGGDSPIVAIADRTAAKTGSMPSIKSVGALSEQPPSSKFGMDGHRMNMDVDEVFKEAKKSGGWLAGSADRGSKECVAFVKYAVPELGKATTADWKEDHKITGYRDPLLEPGTAIATFVNGKYPSSHGKSHAAIFLNYGIHPETGERGMFVLDQHNKKVLSVNFISFDTHSQKFTSQARNYSVIKK